MTDALWSGPAAGTPFAPKRLNASFMRQVYSRVPISGDQWTEGRTAQFVFKSTPDSLVHLPSSRIVVKMKLTDGAGNALPGSVRLQSDPINAGLFNQMKYAVNGVVINAVGANLGDFSNVHHRLTDTFEGQSTIGTTSLIGFKKDMFHPLNGVKSKHIASSSATTHLEGELLQANLGMCKRERVFDTNIKQSIIQANTDGATAYAFEVDACPALPFWRQQQKALGMNLEHSLECTIQTDFKKHLLFSGAVKSFPSPNTVTMTGTNGATHPMSVKGNADGSAAAVLAHSANAAHTMNLGVTMPLATAEIPALVDAHINLADSTGIKVVIEEVYLNLCILQPRAPLPRPLSLQTNWVDMTLLTRTLQNSQNYTEVFTVPLSSTQFFVAIRRSAASLNVDREAYDGGVYFTSASLQRGSSIQPMPSYKLSPPKLQCARALSDYNRIIGATSVNARGGRDILSWCEEPCLLFNSQTEEASSSITLRFETSPNVDLSDYELLVMCYHHRVAEFVVDSSGQPTSTLTDELVL
jgi:hypothetical protein